MSPWFPSDSKRWIGCWPRSAAKTTATSALYWAFSRASFTFNARPPRLLPVIAAEACAERLTSQACLRGNVVPYEARHDLLNWSSSLGTIIIDDEAYSGNQETLRVRPRPLPRHHWPRQEEPRGCPEEKDFHSRGHS